MHRRTLLGGSLAFALAGGISKRRVRAQSDTYTIEAVPPLDGDDATFAFAISPRGWVTGMSRNSGTGQNRVFIYRDGKIRERAAGGNSAIGWSINTAAQIVGNVALDATTSGAGFWDGSQFTLLPTVGGASAQAFGINDDAIVAGGSQREPNGPIQACVWRDGAATPLETLAGVSLASAINASGVLAGSASPSTDATAADGRATRWDADGALDLGVIAGPTSLARAINDDGVIAGHTTTTEDGVFGSAGTHAFVWQDGTMTDLGALPGTDSSFSWDINAAGVISGSSANPNPPADGSAATLAVLWVDGEIVDLTAQLPEGSGWVLTGAYSINDGGVTVGAGMFEGKPMGYVLTPSNE